MPQKLLSIAVLGYRSQPNVGGQGIYLARACGALAELGHKVTVFSGPPYPELPDSISLVKVPSLDLYAEDDHVTALRWHHLRSWSDFAEWWIMLTGGFGEPYTFGRRVRKLINKDDFDVVYDNQSLCYGLLDIQNKGIPVAAMIHHPITRDRDIAVAAAKNWQYRLLAKRWYSFLRMQKRVVNKLQHLVTVSRSSAKDIEAAFGVPAEDITLAPCGVDLSTFRDLSKQRKTHQIITTSSSDQPLKGLIYLIEALPLLKKKYPGMRLLVIGKLKENSAVAQKIETLGLSNTVSFVSGIPTDDMVKHYNDAHVAVCPSLYEGFGLPAIEAMACGTPLVSTTGGALKEVVGDNGVLVEPANAEALAKAIDSLFADASMARALSEKAQKYVEQNFSWQQHAMALESMLNNMLAKQNTRKQNLSSSELSKTSSDSC